MIVIGMRDGREVLVGPDAALPFVDADGEPAEVGVADVDKVILANLDYGVQDGEMNLRGGGKVPCRIVAFTDPGSGLNLALLIPKDVVSAFCAKVEGRELIVPARTLH